MQLKEINKIRYSKHYKIIFVCIAFVLLIIAPATSALFINLFSNPEGSYFFHNLAGLVVGMAIVAFLLTKFRHHPYMYEVIYVWDLKQQLNRIHRKQRKIEAAIENNDKDAMIIMNFMLHGSKQLYELDDNTITMEDLLRKIQIHDKRMEAAGLNSSTDSYNPAMLERF
jgi:hypothetical protein